MANVGAVISVIKQTNSELESQLSILSIYESKLQVMLENVNATFTGSVLNVDRDLKNSLESTLDEVRQTQRQINQAIRALDQVAIM